MKCFLMVASIIVFQAQSMHKDPRVTPELERQGLIGCYKGIRTPLIQPDGKKIYFAKGLADGIEKLFMVRYSANDALDISFGQNGVTNEPAPSDLYISTIVDQHKSGEKLIRALALIKIE